MAGETWNTYGEINTDPMKQMYQYGDSGNFMRAQDFTGTGSGRLGIEGADAGSSMFSSGWGSDIMGSGLGLGDIGKGIGAYMGYSLGQDQLDLGREKFDFQKDSWEKQFSMMQDQYYRKLNNRRANKYNTWDLSQEEGNKLGEYYDSGANLEGAYTPPSAEAGAGAPSVANAAVMDQATGGAPFSTGAAQGMINASNSGFNNPATPIGGISPLGAGSNGYASTNPSAAPVNPSVKPSSNGTRDIVRRKKVSPTTQSSIDQNY